MTRLPSSRYGTYPELRQRLERVRNEVGGERVVASDEAGWAAAADARATAAEATVTHLEKLIKDEAPPPDPAKQAEAKAARAEAKQLRQKVGEAAARSAIAAKALELDEQILRSLDALRLQAYGLQAGATVGKRYAETRKWVVVSAALIAVGVILLALAPKPKAEEEPSAAPPAPELVTLVPSVAGQKVLRCNEKKVPALKVGGDKKTPIVIVLPGGTCPVQTIRFVTAEPTPLGKATPVKEVEPK